MNSLLPSVKLLLLTCLSQTRRRDKSDKHPAYELRSHFCACLHDDPSHVTRLLNPPARHFLFLWNAFRANKLHVKFVTSRCSANLADPPKGRWICPRVASGRNPQGDAGEERDALHGLPGGHRRAHAVSVLRARAAHPGHGDCGRWRHHARRLLTCAHFPAADLSGCDLRRFASAGTV
jgi:hypothetical protein